MNFLKIFSNRFQDTWDMPAITSYETGLTLTYGTLAGRMLRFHLLLEEIGATQGSRIAVLGRNSIDWVTVYMGTLTYGATAVTLPATIPARRAVELIGTTDAEFLFIDENLFPGTECLRDMPSVQLVISMDTQKVLARRPYSVADPEGILGHLDMQFVNKYPYGFNKEHAISPVIEPDATVAIFFTSGTTGAPRGVKLMADNLEGNIIHGIKTGMMPRGTESLISTSLGNVWTTVYNLLVPLASGAHLTVFTDVNDPKVLLEVVSKTQSERLILTPRKAGWIYNATIKYADRRSFLRYFTRSTYYRLLKKLALKYSFNKVTGGKCKEIIIFAYPMGPTLINKLRNAGIPITQGYGLAECGGLISYSPHTEYTPGTSGVVIRNTIRCRLRPLDIEGLPADAGYLEVSGMTVMKGYVDDKLNEAAFTQDNWLRTGDIATITPRGEIKIIGRKNTLIMKDNYAITPERLAILLMDMPYVCYAVVVMKEGALTAIIEPNVSRIMEELGPEANPVAVMNNMVSELNRITALPERIERVEVSLEPLVTTTKRTVARYLYV